MENETKNIRRIKVERHVWPDEEKAAKEKRKKLFFKRVAFGFLLVLFLIVGMFSGYKLRDENLGVSLAKSDEYTKLTNIYNILKEQWYFSSELANIDQQLTDQAIKGLATNDIDPHTTYFTKEELNSFVESINRHFVGIGVQFTSAGGTNLITRVFKNSPADQAGVLAGDIIYRVEDEDVTKLDAEGLKQIITGEENTDVKISFLRDGKQVDLTITRGVVNNTAFGEMLTKEIGYLNIYQFGDSTNQEVQAYLSDLKEQGMEKLIIDLRDNGGGYLQSLVGIAGNFLEKGTVCIQQLYPDQSVVQSKTTNDDPYDLSGIVILINEGTASASEVLTMCLKEQRDDVTVVGVNSYGKGTVQVTQPFSDGSALKYTTSKWLSPNGVWIDQEGITPDYEVTLPEVLYLNSLITEEDKVFTVDNVDLAVKYTQKSLSFLGYSVSREDGYFDENLSEVLKQFQIENDLEVDGNIDIFDLEKLKLKVQIAWVQDQSKDTQINRALEVLNGKISSSK